MGIALMRSNYGSCLTNLRQYERGQEHLLAALEAQLGELGIEHDRTQLSVRRLVELHEAWGSDDEAAKYRAMLREGA